MPANPTRRTFLKSALLASAPLLASSTAAETTPPATTGAEDRRKWLAIVEQVSQPVLQAISQQKLRATMPVECIPGDEAARAQSTHLEAFARLISGLAPWLEGEPGPNKFEEDLRTRYRDWVRLGFRYGCDPKSPDAFNFGTNQQSLVDAASLATSVLRAPHQLWDKLDGPTKDNLVRSLIETRKVQPSFNNWILFSAIIEAMFCKLGLPWDTVRIDSALRQIQEWYKGDSLYSDGPVFHFDYCNSFVIQPVLLNLLDAVKSTGRWEPMRPAIEARAVRNAAILERLIGPDGTFPPIGRSLSYRYGAFHHLAEMSLRKQLPEGVHPAQVRCALTSVMSRVNAAPGTFDKNGWLTIGFAGHQPSLGEHYVSTGSLYFCAAAWLPLGLPSTDEFWSANAQPWTQQKAWSGVDIKNDYAISE